MSSCWDIDILANYCTKIGSGSTPRGGKESYLDKGISLIRSQNVYNTGFSDDGLAFIDDTQADELRNVEVQSQDVLLNITGESVGRCCQVPDRILPARVNQHVVIIRTDKDSLDPGFLRYYLITPLAQSKLEGLSSSGATRRALTKGMIESLEIPIPTIGEQRKIAAILGSLDDKIELNRRMNASLESMAQTIFKSWFIDFDPVHPNAAARSGRKIKSTSKESSFNLALDIDSLFPDSFEESDIGPIPKGWEVELLGNHATITRGLSYKGSGLANSGKPMFNLNSVLEGGGYKKAGLKYYTGDYFDKHEVLPGDLIVANTEQGFDRLLIGYAAVVPEYFSEGGIYSHHIYRVRPTASSNLTARYLERWINSPLPHDWITGYSNGTTVNMLPVDGLTNAQVLLPPSQIILTFTNLANAIALQQQANDQASRYYSQTRDLLLPQLMSGYMLNVS
jgi:type I restriction enzyme S subunit